MSIELVEGWDHYTPGPLKWDSASAAGAQIAGRFGGYAVALANGAQLTKTLVAATTRVLGFAYYPQASAPSGFCGFSTNGTNQLYLRTNNAYNIVVVNGAGTVLYTTSLALQYQIWAYIQVKMTVGTSTGAFEVRVTQGGATSSWTSGSQTGQNTDPTGFGSTNQVWLNQGNPGAAQAQFDDLYVLNSLGSVNNDFLGECRVITSVPNANGATNNFTKSGAPASNFGCVNEIPPDLDTTYNYSNTALQIDLYAYPAIAPTGSIAALQVNLCERKDDVGSRTTCAEYRSTGAVNYDGALQFSPGSQYSIDRQIYETDPATAAAWTTAGVNGGQFGIKLVA